jgi:hypothetical protein
MNQQPQPSPREHNFYIAIAKYLFYHPEHGIVTANDPIRVKNAEKYRLNPLILYGLTVAGLPLGWMTFSPASQPRDLGNVLMEAWRNGEGLRGRPDILWINRHIENACPELPAEMAKFGVELLVADGRDQTLPASLRSAQKSSQGLMRKHDGKDLSLSGSIKTLCRFAQLDHEYQVRKNSSYAQNPAIKERFQQWLALPTRKPPPKAPGELDWKPGPWLSSWETSLPPNRPRYFMRHDNDGCIWLKTGDMASDDAVADEDEHLRNVNSFREEAKLVKNVVACWPNPPAEIARCSGITLRKLQKFISMEKYPDEIALNDLETLLGIDFDEDGDSFVAVGPYVLMANKPKALEEVYLNISYGGDASPCEIVPSKGRPDPSWRYVLLNPFGRPQSIVMAPRGAKIANDIPELLLNYKGIIEVPTELYRDVVSTCARACREPSANIREMKEFAKRYSENWAGGYWESL